MKLGKLLSYSVNGSCVELKYANNNAYVEILTEDIVNFFVPLYTKLHYSKAIDGDKSINPKISVSHDEKTGEVLISTGKYKIYVGDDFISSIYDASNNLVVKDYNKARVPKSRLSEKALKLLGKEGHSVDAEESAKHIEILKTASTETCFYGLGDKTGFINKRGYEYINWNSDIPQAHTDDFKSLYKSIPFFVAKTGKCVYGLFFDNTFRCIFNMCKESDEYYVYEAEDGNLDYYFLGGDSIKEVITNYTYLTGRTPLPQLWTLGHMQCRWGYENERDIRYVANEYRKNRIPCESVQYDIDYMQDYRVFTWDEEQYDKFGVLFKDLKDNLGFKPVVINDPGVKVDYDYFMSKEGHEKGYFAKDPKTGEDYVNEVWPGESNYPDFGRDEVRKWWAKHLKDFVSYGIEGIWNDMNEPASFRGELPKDVIFHDEERTITHREMHNIYGHCMSRATYEGLKEATGKRPFVITRACYAGTQKYSTVWTGDNQSLWAHLQMMIPQLCNLGISGYAIAGVDIGGFGADCTPELMARWIEAAFLSTFFRNHSAKGTRVQEPWRFGEEVMNIYRKYVELHYRFLPYIYDLLKNCEDTGIPPMRPVVLEYENDENTYNLNCEYMVGESMLIAPVLEPGIKVKNVYLPEGVWFDYWTGTRYEGRRWILVDAPLDVCPIFIKGGSIIPMYDLVQYVGEKEYDNLYLLITEGASKYTHYSDNGEDFSYKNGEYNLYEFTINDNGQIETKMLHEQYKLYASITTVYLT